VLPILQQVVGYVGQAADVSAGHCALELSQESVAVDELAGAWPVSHNDLELNDESSTTAEQQQGRRQSVSDAFTPVFTHAVLKIHGCLSPCCPTI